MSQTAYAIARYRGTSPTRKRTRLGPYRGAMPKVLFPILPSYPHYPQGRRLHVVIGAIGALMK